MLIAPEMSLDLVFLRGCGVRLGEMAMTMYTFESNQGAQRSSPLVNSGVT